MWSAKPIKPFEENMGVNFHDLGFDNGFLDVHDSKSIRNIKRKNRQIDFFKSKTKKLFVTKRLLKSQRQTTEWEKC